VGVALLGAAMLGVAAIVGALGAAGAWALPVSGAKGDGLVKTGDFGSAGDAGSAGSAMASEFPCSGFPKFC